MAFLQKKFVLTVLAGLTIIGLSSAAPRADEYLFYRQKAKIAFADQLYIEAARYAGQALEMHEKDQDMHILLVRSFDKMGASQRQVGGLYQQALRRYPQSPALLAYATSFYQRTGNLRYANALREKFEAICKVNCARYRNLMAAES